ncbi:MAG TPA: hypothetical protein VGP82_06570 [Ktedonobacterales bacterium]|nr:hypothetical protein [Ktedonobacterales bacterium]
MTDFLELLSGRYVAVYFRVTAGHDHHVSGYLARVNATGLILADNANLDTATMAGVMFVARENVAFVTVSAAPEAPHHEHAHSEDTNDEHDE